MKNDREVKEKEEPNSDTGKELNRREFIAGLGKWSKIVMGIALAGSALAAPGKEAEAGTAWVNHGGGGGWINRFGGGGGGWVNRGGGSAGWINRGGGGGAWANHGGGSGAWGNHGGGGGWINRW